MWDKPVDFDRSGAAIYGQDKNLFVRFYKRFVRNNYQSELQGRPVEEQKDFVEIREPGAKSWYNGEPTADHIFRFKPLYEEFKAGNQAKETGTPLEYLTRLTPGEIEVYNTNKLFTIEQLANLSDSACDGLSFGTLENRSAARAYLKVATDTLAQQKAEKEIQELRDQLAELRALVSNKTTEEATEPAKVGRPRKVKQEAEQIGILP